MCVREGEVRVREGEVCVREREEEVCVREREGRVESDCHRDGMY